MSQAEKDADAAICADVANEPLSTDISNPNVTPDLAALAQQWDVDWGQQQIGEPGASLRTTADVAKISAWCSANGF